MCGIAGILNFDPLSSVSEDRLQTMRDALTHRGPDGAGLVIRQRIGLAHRRLSIIDLAGGHQPMSSRDGRTWLTYNGEIYNFRELRQTLQHQGAQFTSLSDTEVVLRAYEMHGDACVHLFQGMFAFAIWDESRQRLLLARDRLGIKPLYYSNDGSELLFASEIKAIQTARGAKATFNRSVLEEFLATRFVAGENTFFEGVHKLLPGHLLTWSPDSGQEIRRYWQPGTVREQPELDRHDYVEQVRAGLEKAVSRHMISDVPLGLFLSGGLDSSALAGLMASRMDEQLQTFSVGFGEREANELHYAREAANFVRARHRELVVTPAEFFANLPRLVWHEDEPVAFTSSIPLNLVSRLASEHVKVVLTGEGADELFIGYDYRYRVTALNMKLAARYGAMTPAVLRRLISRAVPGLPRRLRRYAQRTFLALGDGPRDLFFENFSVFRQAQRRAVLGGSSPGDNQDPFAIGLGYYQQAGDDDLARMSGADLQTYLVELLMKQDQMSMAASIESRVPFLDDQLVELVTAIPTRYRLQKWRTKALLRDAVRELVPQSILTRSKMGFPVPMAAWLRGEYQHVVDEFVLGERARRRELFDPQVLQALAHEHRRGIDNHAERLWLLINLEVWQRLFIDGEDHASIARGMLPSSHRHRAAAALAASAPVC